ncbi:MAG: NADH-quinone oxidoreductase subunit NuoK [Planctomycetota bacterium]
MQPITELAQYLAIGGILFALGMIGFLVRRNMIVMFLCAEMMLQGISISLVAWGRYHADFGGQMLVIFIITVAACEAAIALALVLMLFHGSGKLDIAFWQQVREAGQPAFVDHEVPDEHDAERAWPRLTPAGLSPQIDPEEQQHRGRL